MHYSFNPITVSITSIIIAITSITCITASILSQCHSPSPSRLSHLIQLRSYKNVHHFHHHRQHVYHMHYSFNLITISIIIATTSITCPTASIPYHCASPSPSRLSYALQIQSYNKVHHFHRQRHHVYQMH